ncbi:uncharacterized protein LOC141534581 [Cotesia typhae]|uniref:uncharacterized protein LOC141534581 n=1 Tax=Cotesia typhae TaxID=2053667 RepID=UPI003D688B12
MRRLVSRREVPRFGRAYGVARRAIRVRSGSFQIGVISEPPEGRDVLTGRSVFDRLGPVIPPSRSIAPGPTEPRVERLPFRDLVITVCQDSEQAARLPDTQADAPPISSGTRSTEMLEEKSPPSTLVPLKEPVAGPSKRLTKGQKHRQYRKRKLQEWLERPDASPERLRNLCRHLAHGTVSARNFLRNGPSRPDAEGPSAEKPCPGETPERIPKLAGWQDEARALPVSPEAESSAPMPIAEGLAKTYVQAPGPPAPGGYTQGHQEKKKRKQKKKRKNRERGPDWANMEVFGLDLAEEEDESAADSGWESDDVLNIHPSSDDDRLY